MEFHRAERLDKMILEKMTGRFRISPFDLHLGFIQGFPRQFS
jgi:hypothetical protein